MHILAFVNVCREGEVLKVVLPREGEANELAEGKVCLGGLGLRENYDLHQMLQPAIHPFSEFERPKISACECFPPSPWFGEAGRD